MSAGRFPAVVEHNPFVDVLVPLNSERVHAVSGLITEQTDRIGFIVFAPLRLALRGHAGVVVDLRRLPDRIVLTGDAGDRRGLHAGQIQRAASGGEGLAGTGRPSSPDIDVSVTRDA